jgi:aryl-alcohol dehydrogenase-like predicted oxidoreductase
MLKGLQFTDDIEIQRLLNGMWQVSGAHGPVEPKQAVADMVRYHDAGYKTWDLADHYGPAEDLIGAFRKVIEQRDGAEALRDVVAFTKWVPRPGPMPRDVVQDAINVSRRRMKVETLDLLQFHWWDYRNPAYLDALDHMATLRDDGQIRHLALTNFDTRRVQKITEHGVRIVSNQVQFSLIDRRPEVQMIDYCADNEIWLLTYGTLCGGLISDKYLNQPEPTPRQLTTASLRKYKQMIDAWGGWSLFQELLQALKHIADKYDVSIANVATRAILDKPVVAGVIVGVRLGNTEHRTDNERVFRLMLDEDDHAAIDSVSARANDLFAIIGDCGDEYRR